MPFGNPIVGGTKLIIPAIASPNYQPGLTGWTLNKDGTAEFGNAVIRGSLDVTDPDGSRVHIFDQNPGNGAIIDLYPATVPLHTLTTPAEIRHTLNTSNRPVLEIESATLDGATPGPIIQMYADELGNQGITFLAPLMSVFGRLSGSAVGTGQIDFEHIDINIHDNIVTFDQPGRIDWTVPSPSGQRFPTQGKGIVAVLYFTGGGGATSVAGAEAALAAWDAGNTAPDFTAENGHMYSAEISGGISSSVAAAAELTTVRLRKTINVVGSQFLGLVRAQPVSGGNVAPFWGKVWFRNASGANVSVPNLGLTIQRAAGTGNHSFFGDSATAGAVGPLKIIVRDEGMYADHDFANGAAICTSIV